MKIDVVKHNTDQPQRRIRSFVRREGRLTAGQQRALERYWPDYGIEPGGLLDFRQLFGRQAGITLEIGFGNGEALTDMATASPEQNFLGIEVHRPGVGHLLYHAHARQLSNLRVLCEDAIDTLETRIGDQTLDRVLLFFPDPWPKTRHRKRRIVQPAFVQLIADKLRPGGLFHLATDWSPYARHMLATLQACPHFANRAGHGQYAGRPDFRPLTKFERRGQRLGHAVHDLCFERLA